MRLELRMGLLVLSLVSIACGGRGVASGPEDGGEGEPPIGDESPDSGQPPDDAGAGTPDAGMVDAGAIFPSACEVSATVTQGEPFLPPSDRAVRNPPPSLVFQVLSDVHIHSSDWRSVTNMNKALDDLHAIGPNAALLVVPGDLTEYGTAGNYSTLGSVISSKPHPSVMWGIGNHEYHGTDSSAVEKQRFLDWTGLGRVYYEREINGYHFFMLGGESGDADPPGTAPWNADLSNAQLDWLDQRLTDVASDSLPTFVFLHQAPWDSNNTQRLDEILSRHPNIIFFWGHYHRNLTEAAAGNLLYNRSRGYLMVHVGASQYVHTSSGLDYSTTQGVQVEISASKVRLRGRDFNRQAWVSEYQFELPKEDNPDANGWLRDFDGDGKPDVVGQWYDGKLTVYYATGQTNVGTGFDELVHAVITDADDDGLPDVVGVHSDGTLSVYLNGSTPGAPVLSGRQDIGSGWNAMRRVTVADFDGDRKEDLIGTNADGRLQVFFNCGSPGAPSYCCEKDIGTGWQTMQRIRALDLDGDQHVDVLGVWPGGKVTAYLNRGDSADPGFSGQQDLATGFDQLTRLTVADADDDGRQDLLGRSKDGKLWAFLNTGSPGAPGFTSGIDLGGGWNGISRLNVCRIDENDSQDLLGRGTDGVLYPYLNAGAPETPAFTAGDSYGSGWQFISRVYCQ